MRTVINWVRHWISRLGFALYLVANLIVYSIRDTWTGRIATLVVVLAGLALGTWSLFVAPTAIGERTEVTVKIPRGATLTQVADSLETRGLVRSKQFVRLWGRIRGMDKSIKAGLLTLPGGLNALQVVDSLDQAKSETVRVTLPEGIRAYEMAQILAEKTGIDSVRFMTLVRDSALARRLCGAASLDGYLMPETYQLDKLQTEEKLVKFLCRNMMRIFEADSVRQQLDSLGFTIHQVITLASIVEGEALLDRERADIASLYHNRLKRGMRLQADPTIQFAVPGPPKRLLYKDLEIDSPYNTYKYSGLPPGPINNPGKNSVLATIFPNETPYIYMVATGDGGHKFTTNLREHNYWHRKFNEVRRRVRRQSRGQ